MTGAQLLAVLACLPVMVAANVWVHVGPARWHVATGPVAAAVLLLIGRLAGLSWEQLGLGPGSLLPGLLWGGAAAACVLLGYAVGLAVPVTRGLFLDERHRVGMWSMLHRAALVVPLATVVFEEVAFRGVLWGLFEVAHGALWATAVSALLFGLWHVLPAVDGVRQNSPTERVARAELVRQVAGTIAFTALAGLVFGVLRDRSGSLLAPGLLHWATNGLGIVAAALAWRWSATPRDPVD
ncbi:MAG TPA: CPBP family intramembrane glutamic endopeptidase [Ornithinibacter sp.]|nr:CPBP family intramembrane glutamic endopeptidase [Ornithinibacter sp.]